MRLVHRITFIWFCLLTSLVLLVIYLDGGLGNETLVLFIIPMVFNLIGLIAIFKKYMVHHGYFVRNGPSVRPISGCKAAYLACLVLSKTIFEILFCLKLRGIGLETLWVFIPLWVFLILSMVYLLTDVVLTHFKDHQH